MSLAHEQPINVAQIERNFGEIAPPLTQAEAIFEANPIGATCARVCPVEVLCEGACVEKTLMAKPIEIGRLQRYATDAVLSHGREVLKAGTPNGKSVGIVGSGPAGLSCAPHPPP